MNEYDSFKRESVEEIAAQNSDELLVISTQDWMNRANAKKYSYHFEWLGRPIIQYPQDIIAMQEIIWKVKPDLIIETGIAHGGSLIFSASMLDLNATCGGPAEAEVLGVDIEIRLHNRAAIEGHPMYKRITMIEGSSIASDVICQVKKKCEGKKRVLICLDSNHTHEHVLAELNAYAPLTSVESYCVIFDTIIQDMPEDMFPDRPWKPGDNPKTAVWEYLESHPEFEIDKSVQHKLLITVAPDGYLKRVY